MPPTDRELALENERIRRENRILREERDILKKATQFFLRAKSRDGVARQGFATQTTRGFRFVQEHIGQFPTDRLCWVMNVSARGLRAFRSRRASARIWSFWRISRSSRA